MSIIEERVKTVSDIVKSVKYTIWCKEHYYPGISKKSLQRLLLGLTLILMLIM